MIGGAPHVRQHDALRIANLGRSPRSQCVRGVCSFSSHCYLAAKLQSDLPNARRPSRSLHLPPTPSQTRPTMSLSTHINAEKVLKASREHSHKHGRPSVHELMSRDKPGHYDLPPVSCLAARGCGDRPWLSTTIAQRYIIKRPCPICKPELKPILRTTVCRPLRDGTDSEILDSEQGRSASRRVRFGEFGARARWQALVSFLSRTGEARPPKKETGWAANQHLRNESLISLCLLKQHQLGLVRSHLDGRVRRPSHLREPCHQPDR